LITFMADRSIAVEARAATFHESLAFALAEQAEKICNESTIRKVGLTGGVFQNRRLAEAAIEILAARGFDVLIPTILPVNDAGISYGQIVEAAAAGLA
jgi:hydrogenase maturation protein HypF